jgi:hypothetical protein
MTVRRLFRCGAVLWLTASVAPGCGGEVTDPGTGSETNWVSGCSEDVPCSSGACLCGVCTSPCDEADPCPGALHCAGSGSRIFAEVCGPEPEAPGLCLATCGESTPCRNGFRCEEGVCAPQPASRAPGGAVGALCVPGDEARTTFGGFSAGEITVEGRFTACASELCLVHRFQGRVSCPYGQEDPAEPACFASSLGEPVSVPVPPQLVERPAADVVHCSCRCDGPEGTGPFCACPGGF